MNNQEKTQIERDVYVSLRDHFAALRAEDSRRLDERLEAQERAVQIRMKFLFGLVIVAPFVSALLFYLLALQGGP
jgi:hypothetical protein